MEDFLESIERGNEKIEFDIPTMMAFILGSSIRNEVYVKAIFNKLHPDEKEREQKILSLEVQIKREMADRMARISTRSPKN